MKNRYGEADVEVGCAFYGKCGLFAELPKPDEIFNYEKYDTPSWLRSSEERTEEKVEDNVKEYEIKPNKTLNFTL